MSRYEQAEWVPWQFGGGAYYRGTNRPIAVVLHVMQGWKGTARQWAVGGYDGASWHFTVGLDGSVMQHLDFEDGGYHAGLSQFRPDGRPNPPPAWPLWKGWAQNVNRYTLGIEHEGFSGTPMPGAQRAASRALCRWLAGALGVPFDRDHFPAHADIALIDRANDFAPPAMREEFYEFLFEPQEDDMTDDVLLALYAGSEAVDESGVLLPREQRLELARYRLAEAVAGRLPSVNDIAASAAANVALHLRGHSPIVSGGEIAEHEHADGTSGPVRR